ncbi:flavin-containing monooxygenase [Gulosibacter molinativorax]|uniref:NAD(P)/FAD-dependent oxidoreductase n=1 Tax=Gulosibacter molinativorax TaxID=256821 RepID=A0ABT7C871_9MICO|nr:NAD(P)/FAD-dependent oxidoreductase [Gulosibacter molinativorax]MDJ1371394.1 NAD(P)/FAD-dependent oxidoreductase [Gulosibacter molinativorax]QUY62892.1 HapE protein [Gulosibacter molinativorax]
MNDTATITSTDVLIIGAGFSGVGLGIQLERKSEQSYVILERGHTVGGAWRDNTYPGAECDVPSHLYSYSFALNPNWSKMYAQQPEILEYMETVAAAEGVTPHIRFNTNADEVRWDDARKLWTVKSGEELFEAPALIMATGYLSDAKFPEVPGVAEFQGELFHSAEWDHSVDLKGKRVAVIGSGASAIQIIPEVAEVAQQLVVIQRSAAYVTPRHDPHYTQAQKRMFERRPELMQKIRDDLFWANEERYAQRRGTQTLIDTVTRTALGHLERQIPAGELRDKLTPDYVIGCKRILKSNSYYPTFLRENVELVTGGVMAITRDGVIGADGVEHEVDVIIAATGFEATDIPMAYRTYGRDGRTLREHWDRGMEAYKTTAVSGFPNLWFLKGPNTGLGHNSAIYIAEAQMDYVFEALEQVAEDKVLEVRREEQESYMRQLEELSAGTVWLSGDCSSWYVDPSSGRLTTLWPDFSFTFRELNSSFHDEPYEIEKI